MYALTVEAYDRARELQSKLASAPVGNAPGGFDHTSWAADRFARDMSERLSTRTVRCVWCEEEGAPAVIHQGNPHLSVAYVPCLRHQHIVLSALSSDADITPGEDADDQC